MTRNWSASQAKGSPTHRVLAWDFRLQFPSSLFYAVRDTKEVDSPSSALSKGAQSYAAKINFIKEPVRSDRDKLQKYLQVSKNHSSY